MIRRFAAMLLAPTLLLGLTAGCSSTATPIADGTGGATGSGGTGGGDACAALVAAYATAFQAALACDPSLGDTQCAKWASPSLPCGGGCQSQVNDTTELDRLRAQYTQRLPASGLPGNHMRRPLPFFLRGPGRGHGWRLHPGASALIRPTTEARAR